MIGYGVYVVSWWVADVFVIAFGKLTQRIIYRGEFAGAVVMPFLMTFPYALVAFGVGASVAWLVDSERPFLWAIFPTAFYIFFGTLGYHWARQPLLLDRVAQLIDAAFMGIACLVGAWIVSRGRTTSQHRPIREESC